MKQLILNALCVILVVVAFAQMNPAKPDHTQDELARWVQSHTWQPYKSINKRGGSVALEGKQPTYRFDAERVYFPRECNHCSDRIQFHPKSQQIELLDDHKGPLCTRKKCASRPESPEIDPDSEAFPCGIFAGIFSTYSREGDDLVIENNCGKVWLRVMR